MNAPETTKQAAYALAGIYLCGDVDDIQTPSDGADGADDNDPPADEPKPVTPPG